ncbi:MAG: hypothetical protein Q9181_003430 [Wetmoreana brouardii]
MGPNVHMSSGGLPQHCDPTNAFLASISSTFHTCIPTPLALVSTALGILSIVSWLFAQLPQIFKNYTLKSASGLSLYFLAEWLLGDLTNLLGALLTRQATWQVVVAAYYVTVDVCLVSQCFWYLQYKPWREKRWGDVPLAYNDRDDHSPEVLLRISQAQTAGPRGSSHKLHGKNDRQSVSTTEPKSIGNNLFRNLNYSWSPREKGTPSSSYRSIRRPPQSTISGVSPTTLLVITVAFAVLAKASPVHVLLQDHPSPPNRADSLEFAGRILSWMSTLLYLGSRLPQIYKNYKRRSTSGLSPGLFIAAFFGNLFYSSSLATNPLAWQDAPPYGLRGWADEDGSDRITWISLAIPFFLGAAGVLAMDGIVGVQFLMFGEGEAPKKVIVVRDERGRSHWRQVSGWMRGWVPSPCPRKRSEDERPLLGGEYLSTDRRYSSA